MLGIDANDNKQKCILMAISTNLLIISLVQAQLEKVIVTVKKREQSIQKVQMTVTATGGQLLENNEINSISDLT